MTESHQHEFLLFQLYGPLASWGDVAVGEVRPTSTHPSKSAVLGLMAAALGLDREEEDRHSMLEATLGFAVCQDVSGSWLRDYHTVQVPPTEKHRHQVSRRAELGTVRRSDLGTLLSEREYLVDSLATVAIWKRRGLDEFSLTRLKQALEQPFFTLSLGRKSCPLALPLEPQLHSAPTISAAFGKTEFKSRSLLKNLPDYPAHSSMLFYWDGDLASDDPPSGVDGHMLVERRDKILSRKLWQFGLRQEYQGSMTSPASYTTFSPEPENP